MWTATVVEIYVAIIGACAVTLVPVYRKVRYGTPWSTRDMKSNQIASNPGVFAGTGGGGSRPGVHHNFKRSANHERLSTSNDSEEYLHHGGGGGGMTYSVSGANKSGSAKREEFGDDVPMDTIVVQRDVTWEEERNVRHHV